jgi:hypothetical protein
MNFLSLKTKVNVASKSKKHKNLGKSKTLRCLPANYRIQCIDSVSLIISGGSFCRELRKVADKGGTGAVARPTRPELLQLAYHNSLPFIGIL